MDGFDLYFGDNHRHVSTNICSPCDETSHSVGLSILIENISSDAPATTVPLSSLRKIQIFVKIPTGQTCPLLVDPLSLVDQMKSYLAHTFNYDVNNLRMSCFGRPLDGDFSLSLCGITYGSTVELYPRLRGGMLSSACTVCGQYVPKAEMLIFERFQYHKQCFECAMCSKPLTLTSAVSVTGRLFCSIHSNLSSIPIAVQSLFLASPGRGPSFGAPETTTSALTGGLLSTMVPVATTPTNVPTSSSSVAHVAATMASRDFLFGSQDNVRALAQKLQCCSCEGNEVAVQCINCDDQPYFCSECDAKLHDKVNKRHKRVPVFPSQPTVAVVDPSIDMNKSANILHHVNAPSPLQGPAANSHNARAKHDTSRNADNSIPVNAATTLSKSSTSTTSSTVVSADRNANAVDSNLKQSSGWIKIEIEEIVSKIVKRSSSNPKFHIAEMNTRHKKINTAVVTAKDYNNFIIQHLIHVDKRVVFNPVTHTFSSAPSSGNGEAKIPSLAKGKSIVGISTPTLDDFQFFQKRLSAPKTFSISTEQDLHLWRLCWREAATSTAASTTLMREAMQLFGCYLSLNDSDKIHPSSMHVLQLMVRIADDLTYSPASPSSSSSSSSSSSILSAIFEVISNRLNSVAARKTLMDSEKDDAMGLIFKLEEDLLPTAVKAVAGSINEQKSLMLKMECLQVYKCGFFASAPAADEYPVEISQFAATSAVASTAAIPQAASLSPIPILTSKDWLKWRDGATVGWLLSETWQILAPDHDFKDHEDYVENLLRQYTYLCFYWGSASMWPRCLYVHINNNNNRPTACGDPLLHFCGDTAARCSMKIRKEGVVTDCKLPANWRCHKKGQQHSAICSRCLKIQQQKYIGPPSPIASTDIYDCVVEREGQLRDDFVVYLSGLASRKPPAITPNWRMTYRLQPAALVAIVRIPFARQALHASDIIYWAEIISHEQNGMNEYKYRREGKMVLRLLSISDCPQLVTPIQLGFEKAETLAVIDLRVFVPEVISVLSTFANPQFVQEFRQIPFVDRLINQPSPSLSSSLSSSPHLATVSEIKLNSSEITDWVNQAVMNSEIRSLSELKTEFKQQIVREICELAPVKSLYGTQLSAFANGLVSALHCTHGPPGTGKSYVGVCLVLALVIIRNKVMGVRGINNLGPIIALSYKNHALDEFLLDLIGYTKTDPNTRKHVKQLIRLGTKPEAAELEEYGERNNYEERDLNRKISKTIQAIREGRKIGKNWVTNARKVIAAVGIQQHHVESICHSICFLLRLLKDDSILTDPAKAMAEIQEVPSCLDLNWLNVKHLPFLASKFIDLCDHWKLNNENLSANMKNNVVAKLIDAFVRGLSPPPRCAAIIHGNNNNKQCDNYASDSNGVFCSNLHACLSKSNKFCNEIRMNNENNAIKYCKNHACARAGCVIERLHVGIYCPDHACFVCVGLGGDNVNEKRAESQACTVHCCTFERCSNVQLYPILYCDKHACLHCVSIGCHNLKLPRCKPANIHKYCVRHKCSFSPDCPNVVETLQDYTSSSSSSSTISLTNVMSNRYCRNHKCTFSECTTPVDTSVPYAIYCSLHRCCYSKRECSNARFRNGEATNASHNGTTLFDFCHEHLCKVCLELNADPIFPAMADSPRNCCMHHPLCQFKNKKGKLACVSRAADGDVFCDIHTVVFEATMSKLAETTSTNVLTPNTFDDVSKYENKYTQCCGKTKLGGRCKTVKRKTGKTRLELEIFYCPDHEKQRELMSTNSSSSRIDFEESEDSASSDEDDSDEDDNDGDDDDDVEDKKNDDKLEKHVIEIDTNNEDDILQVLMDNNIEEITDGQRYIISQCHVCPMKLLVAHKGEYDKKKKPKHFCPLHLPVTSPPVVNHQLSLSSSSSSTSIPPLPVTTKPLKDSNDGEFVAVSINKKKKGKLKNPATLQEQAQQKQLHRQLMKYEVEVIDLDMDLDEALQNGVSLDEIDISAPVNVQQPRMQPQKRKEEQRAIDEDDDEGMNEEQLRRKEIGAIDDEDEDGRIFATDDYDDDDGENEGDVDGKENDDSDAVSNLQKALHTITEWDWNIPTEKRPKIVGLFLKKMADVLNDVRVTAEVFASNLRKQKAQASAQALKRASIVGTTVVGASRRLDALRSAEPFAVVVEEACEVMESTLVSVLAVKSLQKLELIGDHRQLPAFVQQCWYSIEATIPSLKVSLFERLLHTTSNNNNQSYSYRNNNVGSNMSIKQSVSCTVLDEQRRMRESIADISRRHYSDITSIIDHSATKKQRIGDKFIQTFRAEPSTSIFARMIQQLHSHRNSWSSHGRHVPGVARNVAFWNIRENVESIPTAGLSACNVKEATAVSALTSYLILCGLPPSAITILTPYKGQRQLIIEQLRAASILPAYKSQEPVQPPSSQVLVSTVDRYQGDENDVVILSLVRVKPGNLFLASLNRFIVAVSRARLGFYIIGSVSAVDQIRHWQELLASLKLPPSTENDNFGVRSSNIVASGVGENLLICCPRCQESVITPQSSSSSSSNSTSSDNIPKPVAISSRLSPNVPWAGVIASSAKISFAPIAPVLLPVPSSSSSSSYRKLSSVREVVWPQDFPTATTWGNFCSGRCSSILACGHQCTKACHSPLEDHSKHCVTPVQSPCPQHPSDKLLCCDVIDRPSSEKTVQFLVSGKYLCRFKTFLKRPECEHGVMIDCYVFTNIAKQEEYLRVHSCKDIVGDFELNCGHIIKKPECYLRQSYEKKQPICRETVIYHRPCGCNIRMPCPEAIREKNADNPPACQNDVRIPRPRCGHMMSIRCNVASKLMSSWLEDGNQVASSSSSSRIVVKHGVKYGPSERKFESSVELCNHPVSYESLCGHVVETTCHLAFLHAGGVMHAPPCVYDVAVGCPVCCAPLENAQLIIPCWAVETVRQLQVWDDNVARPVTKQVPVRNKVNNVMTTVQVIEEMSMKNHGIVQRVKALDKNILKLIRGACRIHNITISRLCTTTPDSTEEKASFHTIVVNCATLLNILLGQENLSPCLNLVNRSLECGHVMAVHCHSRNSNPAPDCVAVNKDVFQHACKRPDHTTIPSLCKDLQDLKANQWKHKCVFSVICHIARCGHQITVPCYLELSSLSSFSSSSNNLSALKVVDAMVVYPSGPIADIPPCHELVTFQHPCGHRREGVQCHLAFQWADQIRMGNNNTNDNVCREAVQFVDPFCYHTVQVECWVKTRLRDWSPWEKNKTNKSDNNNNNNNNNRGKIMVLNEQISSDWPMESLPSGLPPLICNVDAIVVRLCGHEEKTTCSRAFSFRQSKQLCIRDVEVECTHCLNRKYVPCHLEYKFREGHVPCEKKVVKTCSLCQINNLEVSCATLYVNCKRMAAVTLPCGHQFNWLCGIDADPRLANSKKARCKGCILPPWTALVSADPPDPSVISRFLKLAVDGVLNNPSNQMWPKSFSVLQDRKFLSFDELSGNSSSGNINCKELELLLKSRRRILSRILDHLRNHDDIFFDPPFPFATQEDLDQCYRYVFVTQTDLNHSVCNEIARKERKKQGYSDKDIFNETLLVSSLFRNMDSTPWGVGVKIKELTHENIRHCPKDDDGTVNICVGIAFSMNMNDNYLEVEGASSSRMGRKNGRKKTLRNGNPSAIYSFNDNGVREKITDKSIIDSARIVPLPENLEATDFDNSGEKKKKKKPAQPLQAKYHPKEHIYFEPGAAMPLLLLKLKPPTDFSCTICMDEFGVDDGLQCNNNNNCDAHFLCYPCFEGHVKSAQEKGSNFVNTAGDLLCCECNSPYDVILLAPLQAKGLRRDVLDRLSELKLTIVKDISAMEALKADQERRAAEERALKDNKEKEALRFFKELEENVLYTKCPRCRIVIHPQDEFRECFAFKCDNCKGFHGSVTEFCGWCLKQAPPGQDVHDFVRNCYSRPPGADLFGRGTRWGDLSAGEIFKRFHEERITEETKMFVKNEVADEDVKRILKRKLQQCGFSIVTLKDI